MGRFVSRSIVVQIVCLAIGLIFLGIVAVVASTYVRLIEDVIQTALMVTERDVRKGHADRREVRSTHAGH